MRLPCLRLSVNRRSRPSIIAGANAFAASIAPRLPKSMEPHREAGSHLILRKSLG